MPTKLIFDAIPAEGGGRAAGVISSRPLLLVLGGRIMITSESHPLHEDQAIEEAGSGNYEGHNEWHLGSVDKRARLVVRLLHWQLHYGVQHRTATLICIL